MGKLCISNAIKGHIIINNGLNETSIDASKLDFYLRSGWKKGRLDFSISTKNKMSSSAKERCKKHPPITTLGRKCMYKNNLKKMIKKDEIVNFINDGWEFGYPPKN